VTKTCRKAKTDQTGRHRKTKRQTCKEREIHTNIYSKRERNTDIQICKDRGDREKERNRQSYFTSIFGATSLGKKRQNRRQTD